MTTERFVDEDGTVIETEVMPDAHREIAVGQVVSLAPPLVEIPSRSQPVKIAARAVGLTVQIGDLVAIFRVEQGVVALAIVEVL